MSEFNFSCPACGQPVLCDAASAGKEITCPACHTLLMAPEGPGGMGATPPRIDPSAFTGYHATVTAPQISKLAIASLVCSLSSLITCAGWLPGIICGHLAKSRIRRNPGLKGNGLASAGLIIGYLMVVLEAGTAAVKVWEFSTAVKKGMVNARQELATNQISIVQVPSTIPSTIASNTAPELEPTNSGWTTDLSQMTFPDQPCSGKVHGEDFVLKSAVFRGSSLKLTSDSGLVVQVLGLKGGIAGRSFENSPSDDAGSLRVGISWQDEEAVQTTMFGSGYSLKLEFGQAVKRRIAGKIYVCLPDDTESFVAGSFEVRTPKPK